MKVLCSVSGNSRNWIFFFLFSVCFTSQTNYNRIKQKIWPIKMKGFGQCQFLSAFFGLFRKSFFFIRVVYFEFVALIQNRPEFPSTGKGEEESAWERDKIKFLFTNTRESTLEFYAAIQLKEWNFFFSFYGKWDREMNSTEWNSYKYLTCNYLTYLETDIVRQTK